MRLRLAYPDAAALVADQDQQFARGGVLVKQAPPAGLALFDTVELEIGALGESVVVSGQVVQIVAGAGIAVAFDGKHAGLAALVARARAGGKAPAPASGAAGASNAEKIQKALHSSSRDERAAIMRDNNRLLHQYVLRNPHLQLDEVLAIAKMATLSADVLKMVAERREWAQKPDIAIALVRNPKTPTPVAVKLLDWVNAGDLRQLAKDTRTRPAVQQAARKKVLG